MLHNMYPLSTHVSLYTMYRIVGISRGAKFLRNHDLLYYRKFSRKRIFEIPLLT